jgi:multidrug transporter EmrE-like cation transporter
VSWVYVGVTIALTVYGQLIVKWQVGRAGDLPDGTWNKFEFLLRLAVNPWVISVFIAAAIAALSWMAAMTRLELSRAYPFVGLSFVLVLIFSAVFFDEPLTTWKIAGVALIVVGLFVGSRV